MTDYCCLACCIFRTPGPPAVRMSSKSKVKPAKKRIAVRYQAGEVDERPRQSKMVS